MKILIFSGLICIYFLFTFPAALNASENESAKSNTYIIADSNSKSNQSNFTGEQGDPFEVLLAHKLYSEGSYQKAAEFLQTAMDRGETSAFDTALLGICYIKLNQKEKAKNVLTTALKMDDNSFTVHMGLGTLAFENRDFSNAFEHFSHAYSIRKESVQALKGMSSSLINLGVEKYAKGDKKKAEETFKKALKIEPDSVAALRNLGIVYSETDRDNDAIKAYRKALEINPDDAVVLRLLSDVLESMGKWNDLFNALKKLSSVQAYNPYPYEKLGLLYEKKGEKGKAIESFSKAIKYGSEEAYPYFRMAEYLFKEGEKKKAHSNLVLAVGRAVHMIGAIQLQAAGRIKKKKGKLNKEDIKKLKNYSTLIQKPRKVLADSIELLRKIDSSNTNFKKDIAKLSSWYPHNVELRESLAGVLEKEGKYTDALKVWKALAVDHPTDVRAHLGIAEIYRRMGKTKNAMLEYRRTLDLDNENDSVFKGLYNVYKESGREKELFDLLKDEYLRNKRNMVLIRYLIVLAKDTGNTKDADYFKNELDRISKNHP